MSKTVHTSPISPLPGQEDQSARLAASAKVDQVEGTTSQSIRKSSSRALPAVGLSGIRTHLNPGGADGACADGAAGSLNLASETPSLTPALIAEYSTQYVSSSPSPAAMSGNSSPNPINPTAASPSLEAADLRTASAQVDQVEGTQKRRHPEGCTCITCDCPPRPFVDTLSFEDWLFFELDRLNEKTRNPGASTTPDQDSEDYSHVCTALGVMARYRMEQRA